MIKVTEGKQVGLLYHYTSVYNLLRILERNYFKGFSGWSGFKTISFTRNKNFHTIGRAIGSTEVKIVIDGDKLTERYRLQPFNFFPKEDPKFRESEERFIGEKIENVKDYILGIEFMDWNIETIPENELGLLLKFVHSEETKSRLKSEYEQNKWIDAATVSVYIEKQFGIKCKLGW